MTAEQERASIAAWLREFGNHGLWPNCERCQIADAIERGDHITPGGDHAKDQA